MEKVTYLCNSCKDTKHVFKEGVWKRCSCLLADIEQKKQVVAGISIPADQLNLKEINIRFSYSPVGGIALSILVDIEKSLKAGRLPIRRACIQGIPVGPREVVVQTLLKAGVDAGFKVVQYSMEELISKHFKGSNDQENDLENDFKKCNILSIYFGSEIQFRVGGSFLEDCVRLSYKHDVYLLLSTGLSFDGLKLKYDESIEKLFLRIGLPTGIEDKRVVFIPLEKCK